MPLAAAPFEAIIRHRTAHLNFLLNLQSGDVYYMNTIRLSPLDLSLLDRHFPLKAPAVIRLGLSVGSLLNYPLADHDHDHHSKINTFLQYLVNILYESPLVDDHALENAVLSMESEYAALRNQRQQYGKQQTALPFSPAENSGARGDASYNSNTNNGSANDGQRRDSATPPGKLRRPRAAKSIGDLDKLKSLHIDTRLAQQVIKAPAMPAAAAAQAAAAGTGTSSKSRAGSPVTATSAAAARSPASPSFNSINSADAGAKVVRKTASSNRLASKLRKMKSSNSLWGHHSSAAYHQSSPVSEKFSKPESSLSKNNANGDSGAGRGAGSSATAAGPAVDTLAVTSIHKQFSQQNYPINITLDNLYSLSNLLKILIRIFDKVGDFINKQKQLRLSILQNKAIANKHSISNNRSNSSYHNSDNTSQGVGPLADASHLPQPKQQTNYSQTSTPSPTSNVSHKHSINNNNNNIILDDYQPPSKRFPSSYSSSSLVSHSSSSLSASSMTDAASTSASLGVPYNGPISSPSPAPTAMKTASSYSSSLAAIPKKNHNNGNSNELSVPLTPHSSHSTSTASANNITTMPRSNSNIKNSFPQLSSLLRTTTDKASLAGTEATEQSSTSGYSIGDTTAATVVTGGTGPYLSAQSNNASSSSKSHCTVNNSGAHGQATSASIVGAPASKDPLPSSEQEFINDLTSAGFNDTTLQLLEKIDAKIQTDLFEPVFEVLDLICENCVNREINELAELLSGDDDQF